MKRGYHFIVVPVVLLILVAGCASVGGPSLSLPATPPPDPLIGHWGGPMGAMFLSVDAYSNGTAIWAVTESKMIGTMSIPATWEKNPNGSYTLTTYTPILITVAGDSMIIGGDEGNVSLARNFQFPQK